MNSSQLPFSSSQASSLLKVIRAELERRSKENWLPQYKPYPKQESFHRAGAEHRERLLMAANQVGKTLCAGAELAMHVTGRYPIGWSGRKFDRATHWWVAGVTGESTRDNPQRILLGRPGAFGTGTIPKECLIDMPSSRGLPDAVDSISVRHKDGEVSTIGMKSYEKGREKWQGETLDGVWYDEEPPPDIYTEGLTRTNATGGFVMMTFTPLLGMSDVVWRFVVQKSPGTHVTTMTIDDAAHFTAEQRAQIIASYPEHEREARTRGIPQLGSGRVYPLADRQLMCASMPIPDHWPRICGVDFGWDHPSAGVMLAWDRDADVIYVTATARASQQTPLMFAAAVKPWGTWPWAWPHDGLQHDKGSGEQLASQYRTHGLEMLHERATFEDGSSGFEAGVTEMLDRMQTGRLKVFSHLNDWFEEFNLYHRKDGLVVKERDDLLSATRYAVMMRRFARTKKQPRRSVPQQLPSGGAQSWMA
jgi:phage terminase large subunit-like protein